MSVGAEVFVGVVLALTLLCLGVLLAAARQIDAQGRDDRDDRRR